VRAALDRGLVRETHRLTKGLFYLTISIAGGPYVVPARHRGRVMITFAIISKSGEVDVNSIAPGIASALLATVAGLVVAIPALFILQLPEQPDQRTTSDMHVFIDEFVREDAEFLSAGGESSPTRLTTTKPPDDHGFRRRKVLHDINVTPMVDLYLCCC
jgi:biopolymer transport protein ExbB